MRPEQPTLECQACGAVVKVLTRSQADEVAMNPYAFIVYCPSCRREAAA